MENEKTKEVWLIIGALFSIIISTIIYIQFGNILVYDGLNFFNSLIKGIVLGFIPLAFNSILIYFTYGNRSLYTSFRESVLICLPLVGLNLSFMRVLGMDRLGTIIAYFVIFLTFIWMLYRFYQKELFLYIRKWIDVLLDKLKEKDVIINLSLFCIVNLISFLFLVTLIEGGINYDEWIYIVAGTDYLRGFHLTFNYAHPPLGKLIIGIGATLPMFPNPPLGARFMTSLVSSFAASFLFLIGVEIFRSRLIGLVASFWLILNPFYLRFSSAAMLDGIAMTFTVISLYFLLLGIRESTKFAPNQELDQDSNEKEDQHREIRSFLVDKHNIYFLLFTTFMAFSMLTRLTSLYLLIISILLILWTERKKILNKESRKRTLKDWVVYTLTFCLWVAVIYFLFLSYIDEIISMMIQRNFYVLEEAHYPFWMFYEWFFTSGKLTPLYVIGIWFSLLSIIIFRGETRYYGLISIWIFCCYSFQTMKYSRYMLGFIPFFVLATAFAFGYVAEISCKAIIFIHSKIRKKNFNVTSLQRAIIVVLQVFLLAWISFYPGNVIDVYTTNVEENQIRYDTYYDKVAQYIYESAQNSNKSEFLAFTYRISVVSYYIEWYPELLDIHLNVTGVFKPTGFRDEWGYQLLLSGTVDIIVWPAHALGRFSHTKIVEFIRENTTILVDLVPNHGMWVFLYSEDFLAANNTSNITSICNKAV